MTRIVWSPQSLRDIEAIRAYIAEDSPRYADLTVRRIVAAVERLETFPESGRMVPERNQHDLREVVVRRFRVVYRHAPRPSRSRRSSEERRSVPTNLSRSAMELLLCRICKPFRNRGHKGHRSTTGRVSRPRFSGIG